MKKSKIFATVIYFIFTFGIGVVFALTLPGFFASFTIPAEVVSDALNSGDFLTCIVLTEPVGFYRRAVFDEKFEGGGGVILYETVMEAYDRTSSEDGESASGGMTNGMLYKCLEGYVYGVAGRYDVFAQDSNGTSLKVTDAEGREVSCPLLDYDSNGDGRNDGISNFEQSGFIVLELREDQVSSVKRLDFTDRSGAVVFSAEAEQAADFESEFFDCFGDMDSYNEWVAAGTREGVSADEAKELIGKRNDYVTAVSEKLGKTEGCALTAESAEYRSVAEEITRRANGKAIPFIIIYFVVIYIIADFLLGYHFIIKFFSWFLFKVCKIPRKEKKAPSSDEVFGHDYYSMVTLKLDVTAVPEFSGTVEIKYTNQGEEFVFSLLKSDDYTATLRMKAGTYVNPYIGIDEAYAPVDLPDNLEVVGYQMERLIKIVRREV